MGLTRFYKQARAVSRPAAMATGGLALALALLAGGTGAMAQPGGSQPALPDSDSPLAEPVVRAEALLRSQSATAWQQNGVRWLLLDRRVRFELGSYGFRGRQALVRIETEREPGRRIHHLALYIDSAEPLYGQGPVRAGAPRLLVTASTEGGLTLRTSQLNRSDGPPRAAIVQAGLSRISQELAKANQTPLTGAPGQPLIPQDQLALKRQRREQIAESQSTSETRFRQQAERRTREAVRQKTGPSIEPPATQPGPGGGVLPTRGTVRFSFDRVVVNEQPQGTAVMLMGGVRVMYDSREGRDLVLKSERAVLFLAKQAPEQVAGAGAVDAGAVKGVYLESNAIATDNEFTVRAPRIYYDVANNRAILLEAVLYKYDERRKIPLYMRADVLRQRSARSFAARNATLTTSAFAKPHIAIRADRLTVEPENGPAAGGGGDLSLGGGQGPAATQPAGNGGGGAVAGGEGAGGGVGVEDVTDLRFTARGTTLEAGGVPFFYWPYMSGSPRALPLKAASVGADDNGAQVQTRWDLLTLLGQPSPEGTEVSIDADYRGDHGPATGLHAEYGEKEQALFGSFDSYFLPHDSGTDDLGGRADVEQDGEVRGFVRAMHRQELPRDWELSLEGAYVSDNTFLEEFREDQARESKPYETSLYLKKQQEETAFTLLGSGQLNDFTPQLTQLQTPGYSVEKLPELGYHRTGTALWDNRLSWFSETRLGRVRAEFGDDRPRDRGFSDAQARALFGQDADTTFEQAADAAGFPSDFVTRLDTRQELSAPLKLGIVDMTPYVTGRVTAYDRDFSGFNGGKNDQVRLRGTVGARTSTQFHKAMPGVESDVFAVNGLRHVVEPSIDLAWAETTLASEDLPVYDQSVESLAEGGTVRFGLNNTWQTRRGGPGRWRREDWIELQTDLVLRSEDGPRDSPLPRYFGYRPGLSVGGSHFYTELLWAVSDSLGMTGEFTYDFEHDQLAQWRIGATLDHTPALRSFVWFDEIRPLDTRLVTYGIGYDLTTKYNVRIRHQFDVGGEANRTFALTLERRLPSWRLQVRTIFDEVDDEQTVGLVLVPEGLGGDGFFPGQIGTGFPGQ